MCDCFVCVSVYTEQGHGIKMSFIKLSLATDGLMRFAHLVPQTQTQWMGDQVATITI